MIPDPGSRFLLKEYSQRKSRKIRQHCRLRKARLCSHVEFNSTRLQCVHTYLSPDHLGESTNELRRRVDTKLDGFFIDNLPNGKPQSRFQALERIGA